MSRDRWCWVLALAFAFQGLVGLSAALFYDSALWGWHRAGLADALYGAKRLPALALPVVRQLTAMLGGTIVAWSVAMVFLCVGPLRRGSAPAAAVIAASTLSWFAIDTAMSARHGAWVNAAFNVAALSMIIGPLAMIGRGPKHDRSSPR